MATIPTEGDTGNATVDETSVLVLGMVVEYQPTGGVVCRWVQFVSINVSLLSSLLPLFV